MATEVDLIVRNLLSFYDFSGRVVLSAGAGGGQFVEYGRQARKVIAVDVDAAALERLRHNLEQKGLAHRFELVCEDFAATQSRADVVLFEFSLHEMKDPLRALQLSRSLAPDTVVLDHSPGSDWAYYVAEEDKVAKSWNAIESLSVRKSIHHDAIGRFATYDELREKVRPQGQISLDRVKRFEGARDFAIPMRYGIVLL
jgi:predicted RNA methylase